MTFSRTTVRKPRTHLEGSWRAVVATTGGPHHEG
jgi:hypothetical protein